MRTYTVYTVPTNAAFNYVQFASASLRLSSTGVSRHLEVGRFAVVRAAVGSASGPHRGTAAPGARASHP